MWIILSLGAVAVGVTWWAVRRSAQMRREAESRQARVLEAVFAARGSSDGVAGIEIDQVLGARTAKPAADDALLRAAALAASIARPAAPRSTDLSPQVDAAAAGDGVVVVVGATADSAAEAPTGSPVAVRDLVQVFYEARGFRATSTEPAARPVELVLTHKNDKDRSYAFVPLLVTPSADDIASIIGAALRIGQRRVLIATESTAGSVATPTGVRLLDRAAIEAQLAGIEPGVVARIRAAAQGRSGQRLRAA